MLQLPPSFWRFRGVPLAFAGLLLHPGCNSSADEDVILAGLKQDCLINSDCKNELVCAFQTCHQECEASRDCEAGARCVAASRPNKVCQFEEERLCQRTSDCVKGLVCGDDGECRDKCQTVNDCVEDQVCVAGTCADLNELDEDGQLPLAPGVTRGSEGSACVYVSDCNGTLLCRGQICQSECKADQDCAAGNVCLDGRCELDGTLPTACRYHSDCKLEPGKRCTNGHCFCSCAEDRDCPARQICDDCGCQPDPDAPPLCNYNSQCEIPGQVCRNGECDCECGEKADCADGFRCDGCGCVDDRAPGADGVVAGDVTIKSALQLELYRGVRVIQGGLLIDGPLADFGDTFEALEAVDGVLEIRDNTLLTSIGFPQLSVAGRVLLGKFERLVSIDLSGLTSSTVVTLEAAPQLIELDLTRYTSGSIYISAGITSLTFPALNTSPSFTLHDMPLISLSLPELQHVKTFSLDELPALSQAQAEKLKNLNDPVGPVTIKLQGTALTSLSGLFGGLLPDQPLQTLTIKNNPSLDGCELDDFVASFASIKFPDLTDNGPACAP